MLQARNLISGKKRWNAKVCTFFLFRIFKNITARVKNARRQGTAHQVDLGEVDAKKRRKNEKCAWILRKCESLVCTFSFLFFFKSEMKSKKMRYNQKMTGQFSRIVDRKTKTRNVLPIYWHFSSLLVFHLFSEEIDILMISFFRPKCGD